MNKTNPTEDTWRAYPTPGLTKIALRAELEQTVTLMGAAWSAMQSM